MKNETKPTDKIDSTKSEKEGLRYNEEANSFELDKETEDPDYQHPDPYDTAQKDGTDHMSTYDEANPYESGSGESDDFEEQDVLNDLDDFNNLDVSSANLDLLVDKSEESQETQESEDDPAKVEKED